MTHGYLLAYSTLTADSDVPGLTTTWPAGSTHSPLVLVALKEYILTFPGHRYSPAPIAHPSSARDSSIQDLELSRPTSTRSCRAKRANAADTSGRITYIDHSYHVSPPQQALPSGKDGIDTPRVTCLMRMMLNNARCKRLLIGLGCPTANDLLCFTHHASLDHWPRARRPHAIIAYPAHLTCDVSKTTDDLSSS